MFEHSDKYVVTRELCSYLLLDEPASLRREVERRISWINDSGKAASCDRLTRPCVRRPSSLIPASSPECAVEGLNAHHSGFFNEIMGEGE